MIRVPGKFIYLCTPHTGSRSTSNVLLEQCGGEQLSVDHHVTPSELQALDRKRYPELFYALIRNPYEFVLRCYWYRFRKSPPAVSLNDYIGQLRDSMKDHMTGPIIATYRDYVDRYFLFERGLEDFFFQVGFPYVKIPQVGVLNRQVLRPRMEAKELTGEQRRMIEEAFPGDVKLYNRVKEEWDGRH